VPYSPLARGVLTGKYAKGTKPAAQSRAGRGDPRILESEWRPESLDLAQEVAERARTQGVSGVELAVGWVLNNKLISSVLAGPRTLEQWRGYVRALAYEFTAEDEAFFDALVAPGHPSTPGYSDPRYPVEGRPTHTEP
jgi:aryl-alcohol dehydrogenase (NADP+)